MSQVNLRRRLFIFLSYVYSTHKTHHKAKVKINLRYVISGEISFLTRRCVRSLMFWCRSGVLQVLPGKFGGNHYA